MAFRLPTRYRPQHSIGAGGMGLVQLYRDEALDRDVAVKFTRRLDDLERIFDELKALQQIRSNYVVQVYDAIKHTQGCEIALVEEYLSGAELNSSQKKSGRELLLILWQIASGLSDIHSHCLIHRDLKPSNLKYGADGCIKIFDFGLSRREGARAATVGFAGTSGYAAPELYGHGRIIFDNKIDIYAFGATAFSLARGALPDCLLSEPPTVDRGVDFGNPEYGIPKEVADLLLRCLASSPADRPGAIEIRDALARHLLRDQHRALVVAGGREYRLDKANKSINFKDSAGNEISISYNGLRFSVSATRGYVHVNNMLAHPQMVMPGCCVIALGDPAPDRARHRVFATFDISHPEVMP